MSCCFLFYPFKPMDSSKSDVQLSVAEYLEKEKLCQEICETITKSVEGPSLKSSCAFPVEAASLIPELNSDDDVEDILQQISDLLGSQIGDNSQCTDIDGADDLSVDEILKQAEQIVRASTPYFERKTYSPNTCTGVEPLLEPIRKNLKRLAKQNSTNERKREDSSHKYGIEQRRGDSSERIEVDNESSDQNVNSHTPTNDSDDDEFFESPEDSPRREPVLSDPNVLWKSCSENNCNLKVVDDVKKSASVSRCDVGITLEENDNALDLGKSPKKTQPDSQADVTHNNRELRLSDLRVCSPEGEVLDDSSPEALDDEDFTPPDKLDSGIDPADSSEPYVIPNQIAHLDRPDSTRRENHEVVQIPKETSKPNKTDVPDKTKILANVRKPDDAPQSVVPAKKVDRISKLDKLSTAQKPVDCKTTDAIKIAAPVNECTNEDHCSIIADLTAQIQSFTLKIAEFEKFEARARKSETLAAAERQRIKVLQEEVASQEELIVGYQRENQRLSSDILSAKESWKATEVQLVDKVLELEKRLSLTTANTSKEKDELSGHLKHAYNLVKKLEAELDRVKNEKVDVKKENDELTVDVMRLNCELEEYKREYESWNKNENEKLALMESNAIIQSKLSQVNTEVTRKQTEIIRLNGEIGRLRGELEKIRLGSVVNHAADSTNAISQLQAALAMERDNCNEVAKERDVLNNEVKDLRKQVALMDNSGHHDLVGNSNKNGNNSVSQSQMTAELEATRYKIELEQSKQMFIDIQNKYDRDIVELSQQIKKLQKENLSLKQLLNDQAKHQQRKVAANSKMKEDAHLLATIRGLKGELNAREKEVNRLNKELVDAKKTNRRLQQEREKVLTSSTSKMRGSQYGKESEPPSRPHSECSASAKEYNPLAFEDNQEATLFLRNENRTMLEEIKRLEQDLISLHNKRIQDMSDLQEQHEREMNSARREHASKHSSSTVTHLQGQLYTQQMVIHHLKQQIKEYEERFEEYSILKAERDHFERALMKANQKIARLQQLASPENVQYASLLEKLEYLERRHEIREEKLQSIVRDLIAKQKKGTCSENCRDKILNKNREICYYRAEMDKILAKLAEFRWN